MSGALPEISKAETSQADATKAAHTRSRLIHAGIDLFSRNGYDASSTRQIETHAGVRRNLMTYHFGSKERFWKTCMQQLFQRVTGQFEAALEQSHDIESTEKIRFLIRRFIRTSAANPEINRVMFDVSRTSTWQLEWLVEHFGRNFYDTIVALYRKGQQQDAICEVTPEQFYYLLVGATSIFSMAAECKLLTGKDPNDDAMIDAQANAIANLLTNKPGDSR